MNPGKSQYEVTILADDVQFGEGPRWHMGSLWFSDIGAGTVRRIWPDGRQETVLSGMRTPSGLGWTRSGDLLVASLLDSTVYRVGTDGETGEDDGARPEERSTADPTRSVDEDP
mgnify:CR=1 FL=1